jgi:hypothetical protein
VTYFIVFFSNLSFGIYIKIGHYLLLPAFSKSYIITLSFHYVACIIDTIDPRRRKWRKAGGTLHNEELRYMYTSPNIISVIKSRKLRMGHVACMGVMRNIYKISTGKPKGKKPLGRPRRRWENNIKMDLREIGWEVVD